MIVKGALWDEWDDVNTNDKYVEYVKGKGDNQEWISWRLTGYDLVPMSCDIKNGNEKCKLSTLYVDLKDGIEYKAPGMDSTATISTEDWKTHCGPNIPFPISLNELKQSKSSILEITSKKGPTPSGIIDWLDQFQVLLEEYQKKDRTIKDRTINPSHMQFARDLLEKIDRIRNDSRLIPELTRLSTQNKIIRTEILPILRQKKGLDEQGFWNGEKSYLYKLCDVAHSQFNNYTHLHQAKARLDLDTHYREKQNEIDELNIIIKSYEQQLSAFRVANSELREENLKIPKLESELKEAKANISTLEAEAAESRRLLLEDNDKISEMRSTIRTQESWIKTLGVGREELERNQVDLVNKQLEISKEREQAIANYNTLNSLFKKLADFCKAILGDTIYDLLLKTGDTGLKEEQKKLMKDVATNPKELTPAKIQSSIKEINKPPSDEKITKPQDVDQSPTKIDQKPKEISFERRATNFVDGFVSSWSKTFRVVEITIDKTINGPSENSTETSKDPESEKDSFSTKGLGNK